MAAGLCQAAHWAPAKRWDEESERQRLSPQLVVTLTNQARNPATIWGRKDRTHESYTHELELKHGPCWVSRWISWVDLGLKIQYPINPLTYSKQKKSAPWSKLPFFRPSSARFSRALHHGRFVIQTTALCHPMLQEMAGWETSESVETGRAPAEGIPRPETQPLLDICQIMWLKQS